MLGEVEFKDIGEDMHNAYVDSLRTALNVADDYRYISSSFSVEYFRKLVEIIGEENIVIATANQKDDIVRISAFISPEGIENTKKNITE